MSAVPLTVVSDSLPASRKVFGAGRIHPQLRVPMREIALHPSAGEPPLIVYDSSGPYTDPAVRRRAPGGGRGGAAGGGAGRGATGRSRCGTAGDPLPLEVFCFVLLLSV